MEWLKDEVGGWLQEVPRFTSLEWEGWRYSRGVAWADEEGKLKGHAFNAMATAAWIRACPDGDVGRMTLVGTVLFVVKAGKEKKI